MNLHRIGSSFILLMVLAAAGCAAPATATESPTQQPTIRAEATSTNPPSNTESPTLVATTAPSMEAGARYYYVDGTTLVAVPAGEFAMGADGQDNPEHRVTLGDFWIYSTKVTNQQYALCQELGKCTAPNAEDDPNYQAGDRANDPIVGVTYDQAVAYCTFVQGRLPTEAEWEKASRNPDGGLYPWGDAAPSCDLANFKDCVGSLTNVINFEGSASFYGALGMAGNSFEWVADWYAPDYYASSPAENPQGPESGTARAIRSSSYESDANQLAVTNRGSENPENHRPDLGFRCVVEDPTYFAPSCQTPLVYGMEASAATQAAAGCPALDIKQAPYCSGTTPLTNVTFSSPSDANTEIDASGCTPSGNSNLYTCKSLNTVVSMTASCQFNLTGNSSCPSGYAQQGQQCVADGSAGQCLVGNFDSANQCCTTQNAPAKSSRVCPAGTFYSESKDACLTYPVKELVTVSAEVQLIPVATCQAPSNTGAGGGGGGGNEGGGGGGPTPGVATAPSCPVGDWDPVQNCCAFLNVCY